MHWGRENPWHIEQKGLAAVGRLAIETSSKINQQHQFRSYSAQCNSSPAKSDKHQ